MVSGSDPKGFIDKLAQVTHAEAATKGCQVPYAVIREIVENLIHADFLEVVISISADGRYIRISDQGPGIPDVEKAFTPGFSTANQSMKSIIKGVGSGLSLARDFLRVCGGKIVVEKNLGHGTVVTLYDAAGLAAGETNSQVAASIKTERDEIGSRRPETHRRHPEQGEHPKAKIAADQSNGPVHPDGPWEQPASLRGQSGRSGEEVLVAQDETLEKVLVSSRQERILKLAARSDQIGPSDVAAQLDISLSTAFRDLVSLEEKGLLTSDGSGKRKLTKVGESFLGDLL